MPCDLCDLPIGQPVDMDGIAYSGCIHCNYNLTDFYPRTGLYVGLRAAEDGVIRHYCKMDHPFTCPGCGHTVTAALYDCLDGGAVLTFSQRIEHGQA